MTNFHRPVLVFVLRIVLPTLLVLAVAIFAGGLVLRDMVDQVDRIEERGRERSVHAALKAYLSRLHDTHGDYSVWNEAVAKLYGKVDQSFVDSNLVDSSRSGVLFDSVYLLDENNRNVFGYQRGIAAIRTAQDEFGAPLDALVDDVREKAKPFDAEVGFLKARSGDIVAVAVGSVMPTNGEEHVPAGRPRILVIGRVLDSSAIQRVSNEYALDGLALHQNALDGPNVVPILDPAGNTVAVISWVPSRKGGEAFQRIAPTTALVLALVVIVTAFLLSIGYRNLVQARRREQDALRIASHDGLTGLLNRGAFNRALEVAVAKPREPGDTVAVIYLDLDGFKQVNDAYGHEAGDRLLVWVANGFQAICTDAATLARVGGDEFAVALEGMDAVERAGAIARRMVCLFDDTIVIEGREISISTSAGVASLQDEPISADELLRRGDIAMYLAKEFGRNRVAIYDPSIDAARAERMRLADDLRVAIDEDRLAVVYQPIFDSVTMKPDGVEALLRWLHPVIGLVPPDQFVPIAEENGLIERIGEWVLRQACRDALEWTDVMLSVNVSAVQFRNPGFDVMLAAVVNEIGFPIERLEIEMTETNLVAHPDRAKLIIDSIRAQGVTIALDDFGTGYSSIGYLRRFSFDRLKLDRSLVINITRDDSARRLMQATVALARALDLKITAEGVETEFEATLLRDAGCGHLQGYAFARPMTAEAVGLFLAASQMGSITVPWMN